jgi:hypothetical protein
MSLSLKDFEADFVVSLAILAVPIFKFKALSRSKYKAMAVATETAVHKSVTA